LHEGSLSPGSYHLFPALKQNRGIHQLTNYCDAPKILT